MKTVLFSVGPALGHIGRSLVIARALREASPAVRIVIAHISPGYGDQLLSPEFDCIPIPHDGPGSEVFADSFEQIITMVDPSLLCLDLSPTPWLYLVRFPEVPKVYITNFFLTSLTCADSEQTRDLRNNDADWNRRRISRHLPELWDAKRLYDADAVLLCDPVELLPSDVKITTPYHVPGPCVWQPEGLLPPILNRSRHLLLVTLGSTGQKKPTAELVEKLRNALDCDKVVWVRDNRSAQALHEYDLVCSWVPLWPILEKCALAITQGGTGSTYSALLRRVPVAISPGHRNHEILGEQLERAGVGSFVADLAQLEPEEIRERVEGMKSCCRSWGPASCESTGPANAAEILSAMI